MRRLDYIDETFLIVCILLIFICVALTHSR